MPRGGGNEFKVRLPLHATNQPFKTVKAAARQIYYSAAVNHFLGAAGGGLRGLKTGGSAKDRINAEVGLILGCLFEFEERISGPRPKSAGPTYATR